MRLPAIDQHPAILVDVDDVCWPGGRSRCRAHRYLSSAVSPVMWRVDINAARAPLAGHTISQIHRALLCWDLLSRSTGAHGLLGHRLAMLHSGGDSGPGHALCFHVYHTVECSVLHGEGAADK